MALMESAQASVSNVVIVGATSAIGQACARLWLKNPALSLTLVGRDAGRLGSVASALRSEAQLARIRVLATNFDDPMAIQRLAEEVSRERAPDIVLIAHGRRADQQICEQDLSACRDSLSLNGISPALFALAFAGHMEQAKSGALVIIGSVTGDRGRKRNYIYGAAKGMLERLAEGLAHRLAASRVRVILVKPGPTGTAQTDRSAHPRTRLATPELIAQGIVSAALGSSGVVYLPSKWRPIMFVVRNIPAFLFNRLDI